MSVVALVCDTSEARSVVTWAARFAAALDTDLIIFSPIDPLHGLDLAMSADCEEQFVDALSKAIHKIIETVVRTRNARKGRLPRYAVSLRRFADPDPVASTISRVKVEAAGKNKKERKRREESDFLQYQDEHGMYADFHANRHTFISNLAKSGVSPKVAQTMARHSDINFTMNVYSHVEMGEQVAAISELPAPPKLTYGKGQKRRKRGA